MYRVKHGLTSTRPYSVWEHIIQRCNNPKNERYKNYGGRGIKVCDQWQGMYGSLNFYIWALNNGYDDTLSIDRIDVNGNYEPNNCRWATEKEQQNNRTNNHLITFDGRTQTLQMWADEYGIYKRTLLSRLEKGMPIDVALTIKKHKRYNKTKGEKICIVY